MLSWSRAAHRLAAALGFALTLAGCVAGPNYVRPAPPSSPQYTATPVPNLTGGELQVDTSASLPPQWWTLLASAKLNALMQQALDKNHTLASSRATLLQAQALADASTAGLFPHVDLDASSGRQKYGAAFLGPEKLPPFTFYSIGAAVSYSFDFAGGVRRGIEQERAEVEYEQHELEAAMLSVGGNVARQALAIAAARAQIDSLESVLKDDADDLKLVQGSFDAGAGTRVDVLNAQSQLANDQTLLPALRRELSQAQHALALLVGQSPADWTAPDFDLHDFTLPAHLPLSLPSEMAHRRPDILAAEARLHAATAALGVASANLYPQISLSASASMQSNVLHALFNASSAAAGVTGSLTQPLFDHGALKDRQQAARQAAQASLADYEQVVLNSFGQVADALEALDHDQELIVSEQSAVGVAGDGLSLTRESYSAGNSGVLQVLEAQRQSEQARLGLARAQAQRLQDTVDLLLALGGSAPLQ